MIFIEILKVIILGIVEGITEWLPISSTGHMILVNEFIKLNVSSEFKEMFLVVIQLGAILAVVFLFFNKLNPFIKDKAKRKEIINFWIIVLIGCVPAGIIGVLFDDYIDAHFYNSVVVSLTLIIYGIFFIIIENNRKGKVSITKSIKDITPKLAICIGLFQLLSLIPGTSRSGTTILGGLLLGMDRVVAVEYTFFLAIPIMFGASLLKILKFGFIFSSTEIILLLTGMLVAFSISLITIKYLMKYIKKNDFKAFGWYRIVLGIIVLIYFLL
ncbi:MAG TPA: undecaprenyl-diphosphate phosphatase [Bacilli bacterium]|nr:undecaprenyl-diphosphate phosphatase [Bacilli bacterium]